MLPLPANLEVTLGGHSRWSLTIPRCKIGTRPWPRKSELTPRIHYGQVTESAGNGVSTLTLKPMGGVNWSPKQRVPVAPQDGDIVTTIFLKKNSMFLILSKYLYPKMVNYVNFIKICIKFNVQIREGVIENILLALLNSIKLIWSGDINRCSLGFLQQYDIWAHLSLQSNYVKIW